MTTNEGFVHHWIIVLRNMTGYTFQIEQTRHKLTIILFRLLNILSINLKQCFLWCIIHVPKLLIQVAF